MYCLILQPFNHKIGLLCLNSNETPLIYANKRYAYKKVSVQIGNITKLQILQQT